jgi:hypothetical protein
MDRDNSGRQAPFDLWGGSANTFGQRLTSAMLHDIVHKLDQQALDLERQRCDMESQRVGQRLGMRSQRLERNVSIRS